MTYTLANGHFQLAVLHTERGGNREKQGDRQDKTRKTERGER